MLGAGYSDESGVSKPNQQPCSQTASLFVQNVLGLPLVRFEQELANSAGYGSRTPIVIIHRSKFKVGESFAYLQRC